ncbi:MAG: DUF1801 domain-containing protein [Ignavibacteria bacterium]|nr:DUF1801 domain-containing protein [Ignavibacteria bacterium]
MKMSRVIHPDFLALLELKDPFLVELFTDLRIFVMDIYPECYELLYHTHALTAVFSVTEKLSDAFCMLPVYTNHVNLGFNKGTLLRDPNKLLQGTGKLIRHIPVSSFEDYRNNDVKELVNSAVELALKDSEITSKRKGKTISKIKK